MQINTPAPLLAVCGPMVLRVPASWSLPGIASGSLASPSCCPGDPFSIFLSAYTRRRFTSMSQLGSYLAMKAVPAERDATVERHVALPAGPAVVVSGRRRARFYNDYWVLHDGTAYVLHGEGSASYGAAHPAVVAQLAAKISFDDDDYQQAYDVSYNAFGQARLGGTQRTPQLTIAASLELSTAEQWSAYISLQASSSASVRIRSVEVLLTQTPRVSDDTIENTEPSVGSSVAGKTHKPFALTLHPKGNWSGFVEGPAWPAAGRYGSLRIDYTINGRPGTYTSPARERVTGFFHNQNDQLFPVFRVEENKHALSDRASVTFDAYYLDAVASPGQMTISVPAGFGVDVTPSSSGELGSAELETVDTPGGPPTLYTGRVIATSSGATCGSQQPAARWEMEVRSKAGADLTIPIMVHSAGSSYALTICFDRESLLNVKVSGVAFATNGVFRNPSRPGQYLFSAALTPFAVDGHAIDSAEYELRAYEALPQILTATPSYDAATKTFTVSGLLVANKNPRPRINVHIYVGQTNNGQQLKELAMTPTQNSGEYTFSTKLALAPRYVLSLVNPYRYRGCAEPPRAPAGCLSHSIDGATSPVIAVP
jgi:hypothetical protein